MFRSHYRPEPGASKLQYSGAELSKPSANISNSSRRSRSSPGSRHFGLCRDNAGGRDPQAEHLGSASAAPNFCEKLASSFPAWHR